MRTLVVGLSVLLVAACGGTSAPAGVRAEPAGPDHLLALSAKDLGDGWTTTDPGTERGCVSRYAAGLGGTVETVSLGRGDQALLEEIRTVPGKDTEQSVTALQAACPREEATPPSPAPFTRYGMDPVLRGTSDSWSLWQPTDTGVVVLTGRGLAVKDAYDALDGRHTAWQRDRLARARALWEAHGPASYTMTQRWGCFCPSGTFAVTVVDGTVTRTVDEKGVDAPHRGASVDQLLAQLAKLERPTYVLQYDPELGYPTRISADPIVNAIDDEYGVQVSDLKAT